MSNLQGKERELALMKQKCALLEKDLKIDQLLETVSRLREDKEIILKRIEKIETGSTEGEQDE